MYSNLKQPRPKSNALKASPYTQPSFADSINREFYKIYTAHLSCNKICVRNELDSVGLYRLGCFGKGEYSRSEPTLNGTMNSTGRNRRNENADNANGMSLEFEDLVPISREVYDRRMQWSSLLSTKTVDQQEAQDFHRAFLGEYVANSITRIDSTDPTRKCRINIGTVHNDKQLNPFNFVIKNLPDSILIENLCLSYEEAFYLSYALGCLRILKGVDDSVMTNSELWKFFSTKDDRFACKYIVYHKLRSTGWILKSGIKYGTDFLVYYKGPEQYHSSFSVIVKQLSGTTLDVDDASSFMKLAGLIRINENVSKEVIICYVLFDPNSDVDLSKPSCIKHACVYQMAVRRWIPEENRSESSTLISGEII